MHLFRDFCRVFGCINKEYAGSRSEAGFDVQLRDDGAPDTCGSSGSEDTSAGGRCFQRMDAEMEAMYASWVGRSIAQNVFCGLNF